jgi:hypothetical protein
MTTKVSIVSLVALTACRFYPVPMPKKKATAKTPPNRDPEHMRLIGARGGRKTAKRGKKFFSKIAKKSHPKNNPGANRPEYRGGRKPNPPEIPPAA